MPAIPRRSSVAALCGLVLASLAVTAGPAAAATPDWSTIRISEVKSDGSPDFVELTNTGTEPVDLQGLTAVDNDPAHTPIAIAPGSTVLQPGAFFSFAPDDAAFTGHFGLGSADSITIFQPGGSTVVDTYAWTSHRTPSYARCPIGSATFVATTAATRDAANACPVVDPTPYTKVKINEVESNGDKVADWVELTNTGTSAIDVSGWKILDNDPAHVATPVVVPNGTSIAPGGYYAIYTEIGQTPGFGLGGNDSATVYLPDGTTVVDSYAWTSHATTTYGRCPSGTGAFTTTTTSTRGAANACSAVRINEIESSDPAPGPDFVELTNISAAPVDISGWVLKDSGDTDPYTFPSGTSVPAHGYTVVEAGASGFAFGLGGADSVRLFGADGTTLVESYTWTTAATQTYGRCKDGLGDFADTKAATKGAANSCPGLDTAPWPGSQSVATADLTETFTQDLSGLAFDPANPDVLWGAQNKKGTLFRLVRSGQNWVPDTGWGTGKDPKYTDGTGAPDTEGITIGPDGAVYLASERNNDASGVSRMSVLRYDPAATGSTITATDEWNLTSQIPSAGANLGLEGVTWIPDSFLVGGGFIDQSTGQPYRPADYPLHGTGLYVVAVEDTGDLHAFALDSTGGTSHRIATIASGFPHLADVTFDPERQRLWAVTDDTVDGQTSQLKLADGAFSVDTAYDRPGGMPNLNNEGFAISAQSQCVGGSKEVLWSDDGDTDGHSLRTGTITCTPPAAQTVTFTSTAPSSPVVGQTYPATATGGASGRPVVLGASGSCSIAGGTVTFDHAGTCTVTADQAAAPGYLAGTATQTIAVGQAATTTGLTVTPTSISVTVDVKAPGAGTPTGTVEVRHGTDVLGTVTVSGGTASLDQGVATGGTRDVTAVYAGSDDFSGSDATVDRTRPSVAITGVTKDRLYVGSRPTAKCLATDALSGVRSCTIVRVIQPRRTTLTATAVDRAGNVAATTLVYRTLAYTVRDATYEDGEFVMKRGRHYRLDGTVESSGRVHGPAQIGTEARKGPRLRDGRATITIPRSARPGSHWKVLVDVGPTTYTVKIRAK